MHLSAQGTARAAGVLLLLVIPLLVISLLSDPGLDSRPDQFIDSFARLVPLRARFLFSNAILLLDGLVALATTLLLFRLFRPWRSCLTIAATVALLAASVFLALAAVAGFRVYQLAGAWPGVAGTLAGVAQAARLAQEVRVLLLITGMPLLLVGLLAWGTVIYRRAPLPRWLAAFPLLSGLIMLLSPLGFLNVLDTGFGGFLIASALVLFVWLLLEGAWLVLRGLPGHESPERA